MFTWRVLAVLSMASSSLGCAVDSVPSAFVSRVTPGLSNVPWISGSTATNDERIPDVVSNGLDACGRDLEHSRLWRQWPPCPAVEPTAWRPSRPQRPPVSAMSSSQELNQPWLEFIDFDWPCSRGPADGSKAVVTCR
jgi:hypothetical protein